MYIKGRRQEAWGKAAVWYPKEIAKPGSLEELKKIILAAKENGEPIKMKGSYHSLNSIASTSGLQINTDLLNKIVKIDKANSTVTAQAGIKLKNLIAILAKEGLSLPNQPYILEQSVAGAIATATHGSGKIGTLSSFVEELTLIDGIGNIRIINREQDPELFPACIVHLGCLGFIHEIKLRCIPLCKLHLVKKLIGQEEYLEQAEKFLSTHDNVQFMVDPYSKQAIAWLYKKTDEPLQHTFKYHMKHALIKRMVSLFNIWQPPSPLVPTFTRLHAFFSQFRGCVDYSNRILSPQDEPYYIETEICVPFACYKEAARTTLKILDRYASMGFRPVATMLLRFLDEGEIGFMSPAVGRRSAYISLITFPKPGYLALFEEVENALYAFQGRPHWGKVNFLTREKAAELYPATYSLFLKARKELDPQKLFSNFYTERIF